MLIDPFPIVLVLVLMAGSKQAGGPQKRFLQTILSVRGSEILDNPHLLEQSSLIPWKPRWLSGKACH